MMNEKAKDAAAYGGGYREGLLVIVEGRGA